MTPESAGREPGATASNLRLRVISALVLAPFVLAAAWAGGIVFIALVAVASALVIWEWAGITGERRPSIVLGADVALLATAVLAGLGRPLEAIAVVAAGACYCLLASGPWLLRGFVYAAGAALALLLIRLPPEDGRAALFFLLAVVWATDIGAYFAGRAIGGPKLWPAVSPKKTWSGAVGGLLAGAGGGLAAAAAFGLPLRPALVGVALALSIAGQLGDLYESALKRRFGVKDSGTTIPGHGGLMDRVDGLVFAAVAGLAIGAARFGVLDPAGGLVRW